MWRNMPRFGKEWPLRWLRMFSACVKGLATKHFFFTEYLLLWPTCRYQSSLVLEAYPEAWEQHWDRRLWVSLIAGHQQKPHILLPSQRILQMSLILWAAVHPMVPQAPSTFFLGCQSTRLGVDELPDWGGTLYSQLLRLVLLTSYKMRGFSQKKIVVRWEATCSILKQHWYTMCSFCQTKKYILTQFIVHFLKSSL